MGAKRFLLKPRLKIENEKGQGISINMLIIIALAVFAVFLILGFVSGGWSYFAGAFGQATKGTGGAESAEIRCKTSCATWITAGCPGSATDPTYSWKKVHNAQEGLDFNGDGIIGDDDKYYCRPGGTDTASVTHGPMVSAGECSCR